MELVDKSYKAPKESAELADGIKKLVLVSLKSLEDGFQVGQDVPVIFAATLSELVPAFQGFEKIKGEISEDKILFAQSLANVGFEIAEALLKKKAPAA